jgi:AraC-like DNA-binding protein
VTVLVEATTSWGEGIVRGVVNFARINHRPLAAQLMGLGVPTVNVSWFDWEPAMTTVTSDEIGIGRLAAEHATRGVEVADVLSEVPVSRRWLEQRCRELLGRSPAEELRRIRIERAKSPLATSQLPVSSVARRSGFRNVDAFTRRFRLAVGESPTTFRRLVRSGGIG